MDMNYEERLATLQYLFQELNLKLAEESAQLNDAEIREYTNQLAQIQMEIERLQKMRGYRRK